MWQDINRRNQIFSRYEKFFDKRVLKLDFGGFLLGKTNGIFEKFFGGWECFLPCWESMKSKKPPLIRQMEVILFLQEVAYGGIVNGWVFKKGGGIFHG